MAGKTFLFGAAHRLFSYDADSGRVGGIESDPELRIGALCPTGDGLLAGTDQGVINFRDGSVISENRDVFSFFDYGGKTHFFSGYWGGTAYDLDGNELFSIEPKNEKLQGEVLREGGYELDRVGGRMGRVVSANDRVFLYNVGAFDITGKISDPDSPVTQLTNWISDYPVPLTFRGELLDFSYHNSGTHPDGAILAHTLTGDRVANVPFEGSEVEGDADKNYHRFFRDCEVDDSSGDFYFTMLGVGNEQMQIYHVPGLLVSDSKPITIEDNPVGSVIAKTLTHRNVNPSALVDTNDLEKLIDMNKLVSL